MVRPYQTRLSGMASDITSEAIEDFDFGFAENGLTAFKLGKALPSQSFINYVGEDRYKLLVNFILHYIADMDIPIKRCVFGHSGILSW